MSVPPNARSWLVAAGLDGLQLGLFMISAAVFATLLAAPSGALEHSPEHGWFDEPLLRQLLMGLAMGATAVALVYSPLGKRSGAHFNPATTLTFWWLGRVHPIVALAYILAQFAGGALGLGLAAAWLQPAIAAPEVYYVATRPGEHGQFVAFAVETAMAFTLMSVVLRVSQSAWNRWTGVIAGGFVCCYITLLAAFSGMSLNPARSFASALVAADFTGFWIYVLAPVAGMLLAARWFVASRGARAVHCAKLHHDNEHACPFRCGWGEARNAAPRARIEVREQAPWNTTTSS